MIEILLLYSIGKYFFNLARAHKKGEWLFAILGCVSYCLGLFIGGMVIAGLAMLSDRPDFLNSNQLFLGVLCIPFGLLFCWIFYILLKRNWSKVKFKGEMDVIDDVLMD